METAIEFVLVGECKVNRQIAIKKWNLLCRVQKYNEQYRLIETTPKGKIKLKVTIGKEDADYLIKELRLRYVPSEILKHGGTYLIV